MKRVFFVFRTAAAVAVISLGSCLQSIDDHDKQSLVNGTTVLADLSARK